MLNVIGVVAGKGGVGKSTVTANLAYLLAELGFNIGVIDADVYGPSLQKMLRCDKLPAESEREPGRIVPALCRGIKLVSMAFFIPEREAAVVRAPIANGVIEQFLHQVEWGALDYLLIDFPPGTGDIQLTLMQQGKLSCALVVTTPQEVALADVRKAVRMVQQMGVPVAGVIENMSSFQGSYPFGRGGGERLAGELGVPLLAEIPLDPLLSQAADRGESPFAHASLGEGGRAFYALVEKIVALEGRRAEASAELVKGQLVRISWADGLTRELSAAEIQQLCPCVRCREKTPSDAEGRVEVEALEEVGRYALKLRFNSGCSKGLYPYTLLRRLLN